MPTPSAIDVARDPILSAPEIATLIPVRVQDRAGWGQAILNAFGLNGLNADQRSVCAVIAVIGQESGFAADPVVPGLAKVVAARIDHYKVKLGPVGDPLFRWLVAGRSPDDARPFDARLAAVRTERDVDILFRDMLAYYEASHPAMLTALKFAGRLADVDDLAALNPITTAGSMQVSVRFAEEWARAHSVTATATTTTSAAVRDSLYTRAGGVYYGTARLLVYPVHYEQSIFLFADYNAGFYASRNAALQAQVARLTGQHLALDGDLLAYDRNGTPKDDDTASQRAVQLFAQRFAPYISATQIRADLLREKTLGFEQTTTYRTIKDAFVRSVGVPADYAMLPQVAISSPKLARTRSTSWFAQSVERRYRVCMAMVAGDGG